MVVDADAWWWSEVSPNLFCGQLWRTCINTVSHSFPRTSRWKSKLTYRYSSCFRVIWCFLSQLSVVDEDEAINYSTEFLNFLSIPRIPPHNLWLKIDSPVVLLGNLNPPRLCSGIRWVIKMITGNVTEATILPGRFKGEIVLWLRIPSDTSILFKML